MTNGSHHWVDDAQLSTTYQAAMVTRGRHLDALRAVAEMAVAQHTLYGPDNGHAKIAKSIDDLSACLKAHCSIGGAPAREVGHGG